MSAEMPEPSFRFLNLPLELRCMIYEQLEMTTKHFPLDSTDAADQSSTITLVCEKLPVHILATSKLVNTEAMKSFWPRMQQLKAQPMRFFIKAKPMDPLIVLSRSLSRCFRYGFQPGYSPASNEAAEAFIYRYVETRRLASSCRHVEIMVIDKDAPSPRQLEILLCYSTRISMQRHMEITLLRKEPATGIHDTNWKATQALELWLMSKNKRVHLHPADEPDAERLRRDSKETTSASEA